ncbi:histidine kinase [Pigmentibacter ruber]|uniref:hypothetical protein n=1 Tax=Pigmentibacter ruber TaxID=2683196 RepID=UPI00131D31EB|nr:hypothetical protein [Pigmentibacter ruber]BFD33423.1 hypothetical protein GTC16762_30410 [Pigmentibacter ruber]
MRKKFLLYLSIILTCNILISAYFLLTIKSKDEKINLILSNQKVQNFEGSEKTLIFSHSIQNSFLNNNLINNILLIFIFLINILFLLYFAKYFFYINKINDINKHLNEKMSLINLFKKFLSHDIRKPLNLSKMLISATQEQKAKPLLDNISNEVEKSIKKVEDFCDSFLIHCNTIDFRTQDINLEELNIFLQDKLSEEKNLIFKKNYSNNTIIKVNKVYLERAIKSLLSFLKAKATEYNFYLSTNNNKSTFINIIFQLLDKESLSIIENFKKSYDSDFEFLIIKSLFTKNNCNLIINLNEGIIEFNIFIKNS